MKFRVIDNKTGKEADTWNIALHEEWAQSLIYCDMEGFMLTENGDLMLADECGTYVYCDPERFKVVFEEERPHGEWIPKAVHNCWTRFECSVCGYYHEAVHDFGESKPDYNFCPNCGADMREGESSDRTPDNR